MEYRHGGDIYGNDKIKLDFSVNTNPLGIPESVKQAVLNGTDDWSCYPDSKCRELKAELVAFYEKRFDEQADISQTDFICGNGASDLLYSLVFALQPKKALIFAPAFDEYEKALHAVGCEIQLIYLEESENFSMEDIDSNYFLNDVDMVILGNPNNPTGRVLSSTQLKKWADSCLQKRIFLIIDESFNWFLKDWEKDTMVPYLPEYHNIFILNAFTKIYAMAGLRLGYGICKNKRVVEEIEKCRQPWSVSVPAMHAGLQALKEETFIEETERTISKERTFLAEELEKLGFQVFPSDVNFLLIKRSNQIDYDGACKAEGILIRCCDGFEGLTDDFYRVSVKLHEENEQLLLCLANAGIRG
ncbi:MAG: aminotransferase class I/II-fold pyridoxal phosphate-dependent enzyme [Clostridium sp.]